MAAAAMEIVIRAKLPERSKKKKKPSSPEVTKTQEEVALDAVRDAVVSIPLRFKVQFVTIKVG